MMIRTIGALAAMAALAGACAGGEAGPKDPPGWSGLWTRAPGAGKLAVDAEVRRGDESALRVQHTGADDWSLTRQQTQAVGEGDVLEIEAWVRLTGLGHASVNLITRDSAGEVLEWMYAQRATGATKDWRRLHGRIVVPRGVASVQPRLTGVGPATVWMTGFAFRKAGDITAMRDANMPGEVRIENAAVRVTFHTAGATLDVLDRRTGRTWSQKAAGPAMVLKARKTGPGGRSIQADLLHPPDGRELKLTIGLDGELPEVTVDVAGEGDLDRAVAMPQPFGAEKGTYLVVPMNEGISYAVDDESIAPMRLVAYGGHGICMGFWGVTDGQAGHLAIIETPDDAAIRVARLDGRLVVTPEWDAQMGRFGYQRRLRYVFFDRGGHVAICKRYRTHAKKIGLLKTLAEKRQAVPAVDMLVGAVNVWCWDRDSVAIVKEMQAAGIGRILWSHRGDPATLKALNDLGVLTSRYDIYQDVMDPANFKYLRGAHSDWTTEAWPKDLMLDERGQWRPGWRVKGTDGQMRPCGVLCDRQAPPYADKRIGEELKTHPYRCRFIDTTTASPWRECYAPAHPQTRSESRRWKMDLLALISGKYKLVCGSETGHEAAVPFVDYFEGMMSLGPYRVPDAGRDMRRIWTEVPERVAKFQLGHRYRLPLWELVYGDCVVAQWYWGDYNNKLPALWDKRDLFNALYGTEPMFMFDRALWAKDKDRFVRSYRATCPVARASGYREMTDHRFLTADRDVQQTTFAGGLTVTVNFGQATYSADGMKIEPMSCHVVGMGENR